MATEAIKLILDQGVPLVGRLMLYDSLRMSFRDVRIRKDPNCDLCGEHPTITELIDYKTFCAVELPSARGAQTFDPASVEISASELKELLDQGTRMTLLDVREAHEWDIAHLENARLTPLSKFDQYIAELDPEDEIYIYCYKGKRSLTALQQLKDKGFKNLHSLAGGIDGWAEKVDPSMPRY